MIIDNTRMCKKIQQSNSVSCAFADVVVKVTVPLLFCPADAASLYMLSGGDVQLFEVKAFEEDFHSWFVGQTVQRGWFHASLQCELKLIIIIHTATLL